MTFTRRTLWVMVTIAALAAGIPASAQEEKKEEEKTDTVEGEFRFGLQYFLDETQQGSAKFEEYREVPNGFVAEWLSLTWSPRADFSLQIDARDVSQNDQRIDVVFGQIDRWRGTIRWQENQRLWTDQSETLFSHQGDAVFTLEDSFQSAVQAGGANADLDGDNIWDPGSKGRVVQLGVEQGAQDVFVGHHRTLGGAGVEFTPNRLWTFSVSADRERRDGTTPQTLGMYFSLAPAEVASPYDLRTDWLNGTAEYSSEKVNMGVQATASNFQTNYTTLTWDNQLFLNDTPTANPLVANPGRGSMSLWTDSEWARVALFGGFDLPGRTRVDASVSLIETTQAEDLNPMTINSLLAPSPLPASQFDGEHKTTQGQIRISSRPIPEFRWSAWVRRFELDNQSASLTFDDYVQTDYQIPVCGNINVCNANGNGTATDDRIARRSLPYGYERTNAGALVGWSPAPWVDGALSYERESMKREFSAVEDSDEDIYKLSLDFDINEAWGIRTTFRHQERRADNYDAHYLEESFPIGEPAEAGFNEGMRRYYWTDRDRDSASILVDWTPLEAWTFYGEYTYQDNEYLDPGTGLKIGDSFTVMEDRNFDTVLETYDILLAGRTDDTMTSWTLGASYTSGPRMIVYADYTTENWEYGLESRYRNVTAGIGTDNPLDDWGSDIVDDYTTVSLGLDLGLTMDSKWHLNLDASQSRGTGNIGTHFVPGGSASGDTTLSTYPELKTTLILAMAALQHQVRKNLDYVVRYWYENWDEDNFSADFNRSYMGAPNQDPSMAQALYLGLDFKDYTNHILSVMLRYRT